jgi:hypothetical protein
MANNRTSMIDLVYAGGASPSTYEVFVLPDVRFRGQSGHSRVMA